MSLSAGEIFFNLFYKKVLTLRVLYCIVSLVADEAANNFIIKSCAGMAELADAQASGACGSNIVRVQVPLPALSFCLDVRLQIKVFLFFW